MICAGTILSPQHIEVKTATDMSMGIGTDKRWKYDFSKYKSDHAIQYGDSLNCDRSGVLKLYFEK